MRSSLALRLRPPVVGISPASGDIGDSSITWSGVQVKGSRQGHKNSLLLPFQPERQQQTPIFNPPKREPIQNKQRGGLAAWPEVCAGGSLSHCRASNPMGRNLQQDRSPWGPCELPSRIPAPAVTSPAEPTAGSQP